MNIKEMHINGLQMDKATSSNGIKMAALKDETVESLSPKDKVSTELTNEHVPGELIVKFRKDVKPDALKSIFKAIDAKSTKEFDIPKEMEADFNGRLFHVKFKSSNNIYKALPYLNKSPDVLYAEPNYIYRIDPRQAEQPSSPLDPPKPSDKPESPPTQKIPDDLDSRLWGLHNTGQDGGKKDADIDAPEAWMVTTGSSENGPIVAVIDTGVDYNHPELKDNMWKNVKEIPGDGKDNDENGYVDDVYGYNFANNNPDPMDDHYHGTHCAGTIAAKGNNGQGVVGVNWNARIMALKFLDSSGSGTLEAAINAILYATKMGARITSNSWGGGGYSQALYDTLKASPALHIFAAGNSGSDNDVSPSYPASYDLPNIVAVAASDRNDRKASFSCYGKESVDLAAPGKDIYSTTPNNSYKFLSGTSMATPHVAGVAALILTKYPELTNEQVKDRLINTVDPVEDFANKCVSGGRLNAANALESDEIPPDSPSDFQVSNVTARSVTLQWTATGDDGKVGRARSYDIRFADKPIVDREPGEGEIHWKDAQKVSNLPLPQEPGRLETATVTLTPSKEGKTYWFAIKVADNLGNRSTMATTSARTLPAAIAFADDMESGEENWQPESPWKRVEVEGRGKVWTDSPDGNYKDNTETSLTTVPIDLSEIRKPILTLKESHDIETRFDAGYIEISSDNGKNWKTIDKLDGKADWNEKLYNLEEFEGKTIQLRFRLKTDGSIAKDGWYIDDVIIAGDKIRSPMKRLKTPLGSVI